MARASRPVKESSSSSLSPAPDQFDNVAIFPVQLLNRTPSLPPVPTPFPEAEFEDCSTLLNTGSLCSRFYPNGDGSTSGYSSSSDLEDVPLIVHNGKRKASKATREKKRQRLDANEHLALPSTLCSFDVLIQSSAVSKDMERLQSARPGQSLLSRISRLGIIQLPNREEESWIQSALQVYDSSDRTVLTLPIVNTDKVPIEREPHRFTNGRWLESMVDLCGGVVGNDGSHALNVHAEVKMGDKQGGGSIEESNRFRLDLYLSLDLKLSMLETAASLDHLHRLLRFCYPNDEFEKQIRSHAELTASAIYSLLPSSNLPTLDNLQPSRLNASLFPFQKRSVSFLLGREGKRCVGQDENGNPRVEDIDGIMTHDGIQQLGLWWQEIEQGLFYNAFLGKVTRDVKETQSDHIEGGILAEEMGLGKTVEVLALILLNRDEERSHLPTYYHLDHELDVAPTKTTLIVAPETLRQQWIDEIGLHAPDLRVFSYLGYADASKRVPEGTDWRDFSKQFDIIVVSFDTLRKEINIARKAPDRSRRFQRKYERPRSLLIQISFHRVVMDEVQLVGHSAAAETVSMIDRHYSLAVSGTPVKTINDLKSLFYFLRVLTPTISRHWNRLLSPAMIPSLTSCFGMLATRHTKAQVRSEMTLPAQTRVLVTVNFTAIESAFYRDISARVLQGTGVDSSEYSNKRDMLQALQDRYQGDFSRLQHSLVSLRQACTHPQIANSSARGNNYGGMVLATSNTIRSMDEVLTIMIEGTKADQALLWQQLIRKQINRVVLLLQDKENAARLEIAREMLSAVAAVIIDRVNSVKEDREKAIYVGPLYRFTKSEIEADQRYTKEDINGSNDGDEIDHISAIPEGPKTQLEREKDHEMAERRMYKHRHITNLAFRWRAFVEQLHRAYHFEGNTYFQMGEARKAIEAAAPVDYNGQGHTSEVDIKAEEGKTAAIFSPSSEVVELKKCEEAAYDKAEKVRQGLVKMSRKSVEAAVAMLDRSPAIDFQMEELFCNVDFGQSGIYTEVIFDRLNHTQDILDSQTEVLAKWRGEIVERIRKPVSRDVSDEDENDDQYQENLDAQSEAEVLTEMYRVLLNERDFYITGVRVEGSTSKPALFVELERHFQTQKRLDLLRLTNPDDENVLRQLQDAPTEQQVEVMKLQLDHFKKLEKEKNAAVVLEEHHQSSLQVSEEEGSAAQITGTTRRREREHHEGRLDQTLALETMLKELRDMQQNKDGEEELTIMRMAMSKLRPLITTQKLKCEKLKKEHLSFMNVYNARSTYFKRMQELSDDVGDIETSNTRKEIATTEQEEVALKGRIDVAAGRLRYLTAIEEEEGEDGEDSEGRGQGVEGGDSIARRACVICTDPLIKAVIFNTCGHSTCENCFRNWTSKRGTCPMCKTKVSSREVYRVTYGNNGKGKKKRQVQMPREEKQKRQEERYNVISQDLVQSIAVMSIQSALGSKLDLLTRHLLYIEHTKPGTKSLIFTAFSRGITLVGDALRLNNINYVTMDQGGQKASRVIDTFKNSSIVNVLLLHSEAQSSGLNLTCAENVFLLEPLVNHSIELQAIGRVHRIGQTKETTVYIYQVNDTVEEKIVNLATGRGQSLITKENCISKDMKDSAEMVAKTQEGISMGSGGRSTGRGKEGEFVASIEEVFHCLFDEGEDEHQEQEGHSGNAATSSSSLLIKGDGEEDDRDRMRRERVEAIERRQAMANIEREREQQHRG